MECSGTEIEGKPKKIPPSSTGTRNKNKKTKKTKRQKKTKRLFLCAFRGARIE
jgi:hypothetical protein